MERCGRKHSCVQRNSGAAVLIFLRTEMNLMHYKKVVAITGLIAVILLASMVMRKGKNSIEQHVIGGAICYEK